MTTCGLRCLKVILFLLNFVYLAVGIVLLGVGVWSAVDVNSFSQAVSQLSAGRVSFGQELFFDSDVIRVVAYVLVGLGVLVFLFAFFGCWGVVVDSSGILIAYAVILSLYVLAKVSCIIALVVLKSKWQPEAVRTAVDLFSSKYKGTLGAFSPSNFDQYSLATDSFMVNFECCGLKGQEDFSNYTATTLWHDEGRLYTFKEQVFNGSEVKIPPACCKFNNKKFYTVRHFDNYQSAMVDPKCPLEPTSENSQANSCLDVIDKNIQEYNTVLIVVPVVVIIIELFGIVFASILAHRIRMEIKSNYY